MTTPTVEEIVEEFGRFTIYDRNRILLHGDAEEVEEWLRTTLTTYGNASFDEGFEEGVKAERERIVNMIPSERRMVHHVIATGSQEDLNDTFRRGYNKCRNQILELLSNNK